MDELLSSIKEVQEGGRSQANHYLQHGYVLLDIQSGARCQRYPNPNNMGQQYFIRRNPVYILGRPDGVEEAPAPPKWQAPGKEEKPAEGA